MTITDDIKIYTYYIPDVVVNKKYAIREGDKTPSFNIYEKDGRLRWIDFGMPDQEGNSSIDFVMFVQDLSYGDAKDFYKNSIMPDSIGKPLPKLRVEKKLDLSPIYNSTPIIKGYAADYWSQYGIKPTQLLLERIDSLVNLKWRPDAKTSTRSTPSNPHFIYRFGDDSWKVYAPLTKDKQYKWASWNLKGVIEGYDTLKWTAPALMVCSSTKDRLVVKNASGFQTIAPTGESTWRYIAEKKDTLKRRFKNIYVMYDADEAGYEGAKRLALMCGFTAFDTRGKLEGHKDFAEMRLNMGNSEINEIILKIIEEKLG